MDIQEIMEYSTDEEGDAELVLALEKGIIKPGLYAQVKGSKQKTINEVQRLKKKLKEIYLDLPFLERMDFVCDKSGNLSEELSEKMETVSKQDMTSDFARELKFITMAEIAVKQCIPKLEELGIPIKRSENFYAEMAKSDNQMGKIRTWIKKQEGAKKNREIKRKQRESKKYSKVVEHNKKLERQQEKKAFLETTKKYRKGQINRREFESFDKNQNKKRQNKDKKYGFGGKDKNRRKNLV